MDNLAISNEDIFQFRAFLDFKFRNSTPTPMSFSLLIILFHVFFFQISTTNG